MTAQVIDFAAYKANKECEAIIRHRKAEKADPVIWVGPDFTPPVTSSEIAALEAMFAELTEAADEMEVV
jgi:hypothetical protein